MEIDVKKEQKRVKGEMEEKVTAINQNTAQINALKQNEQKLTTEFVKLQGELEYLNRVNGDKSGKNKKSD